MTPSKRSSSGGRRSPGRRTPLRLAFATFELAPLAQTGGLGEAVGGLARALAARGHELSCIVPGHRDLLRHPACPALTPGRSLSLPAPGGPIAARWLGGALGGLQLQVLDAPALFDRPQIYAGTDLAEAQRYIAFARAAAELAFELRPEVLVAHDWHAALALAVLRTGFDFGAARAIAAVQVVHNGAFLGRFPAAAFAATGLPGTLFHPDALEFWGDLALLKGGLAFADRIVAVSPTYASELQTPAFGEGIDGLYRFRAARLVGIANGIDIDRHDPAHDAALAARYGIDYPAPKQICRKELLEAIGLDAPEPGRLLTMIGRLASQKGWDVLVQAMPELLARGASLVLLGDGDAAIAARLREAAKRWPRQVSVTIGWDDALARRAYAGSDAALIPSRFEPCGLVQLLAQRYGTLPIAHRTGGLADTIEDGATGILFETLAPETLCAAVDRGVALLRERGVAAVQRQLLALDVSWAKPALAWERMLTEVAHEAARRV